MDMSIFLNLRDGQLVVEGFLKIFHYSQNPLVLIAISRDLNVDRHALAVFAHLVDERGPLVVVVVSEALLLWKNSGYRHDS